MKITPLGFILAVALIGGAVVTQAAEKSARPNIVFIVSDDQGWCDY
jgi:hypothetical protein